MKLGTGTKSLLVGVVMAALAWTATAMGAGPSATLSAPVVVDPMPQPLAAGGGFLRVAGTGAESLAVYSPAGAILGRRIASNGEPLAQPFAIALTVAADVEVAFDGVAFVVVWSTRPEAAELGIFLQRVSPMGNLLGARETVFEGPNFWHLAMARGELGALLLAFDQSETRTWSIDQDSVHVGAVVPMALGGLFEPSLGYSDGQYLAVYSDERSYFGRIAADGSFLDETLTELAPASRQAASIAPAADGFRVVWALSDGAIHSAAVSFEGAANVDPTTPIVDADYELFYPTLLSSVSGYFLAASMYDCRSCEHLENQAVYTLSQDFEVTSKTLLNGELGLADPPALASVQQGAVLVWPDRHHRLWSQAVSLNGNALGPGPNQLAMQAPSQREPKGASGGDGWLVAYQTTYFDYGEREWVTGVEAARLDAAGQPMGQPMTLDASYLLDVSGSGAGWILALDDPFAIEISVVFVASTGAMGQRKVIGTGTSLGSRFAHSSDGWALVWQKGTVIDPNYSVMISTFDTGGAWLADHELSLPSSKRHAVDVTVVDGTYRAVWSTDDDSIVFQQLTSNGAPVDEVKPLAKPIGAPFLVSHAVAGDRSWVAYASDAPVYRQALLQVPDSFEIQTFGLDRLSPLVVADGVLISTLRPQPSQQREPERVALLLAQGARPLTAAAQIDSTRSSHISVAKDDRLLLTYSADFEVFGSVTERVFASVVQVTPGTDEGGAGGAGNIGEGGSSPGESGAGGVLNGGVGGAMGGGDDDVGTAGASSGGSPAAPTGGESSEGGARIPIDDPSAHAGAANAGGAAASDGGSPFNAAGVGSANPPSRTSSGCGCHAVGAHGPDRQPLMALVAVGIVFLAGRRRRGDWTRRFGAHPRAP